MLRCSLCALLLSSTLLHEAPAVARRRPIRVAIAPATAGDAPRRRIAARLTRQIISALRRDRRYRVVRLPVRKKERLRRCLQLPRCTSKLSRRLRVAYFVAAHVDHFEGRLHLDMRVVAGARGAVVAHRVRRSRNVNALLKGSPWVARRLLASARRTPSREQTADVAEDVRLRADAASGTFVAEAHDAESPVQTPSPRKSSARKPADARSVHQQPEEDASSSTFGRLWQRRYWAGWAAAGTAAVSLTAAAAFGVISSKANKSSREAELQVEAWQLRDKAKKNALGANVLFGLGAVAALASATLFYLEFREENRERRLSGSVSMGLAFARGGGRLALKGHF